MSQKIDGAALRSPLGPILANPFLCFHEQIWFNECPNEFKSVYYRGCVYDILVWFRSPDHLEKFKSYLEIILTLDSLVKKKIIIPCPF